MAEILEENNDNKYSLENYKKSLPLYKELADKSENFNSYSRSYILNLNKIANLKDRMKKNELVKIDEYFTIAENFLNTKIDDKYSETYNEIMCKISKSREQYEQRKCRRQNEVEYNKLFESVSSTLTNLEGITEYEKKQRNEFKIFLVKQYEVFEKKLESQRKSFKDYLSDEYSGSLNDFREEQSQSFKGIIDDQKKELKESAEKQKEVLEDTIKLQKQEFDSSLEKQKVLFDGTSDKQTYTFDQVVQQQNSKFKEITKIQKEFFHQTINEKDKANEQQKKVFGTTENKQKEAFDKAIEDTTKASEQQKKVFETTANKQKEAFDKTIEKTRKANKHSKEMNTKNKRFYNLRMASLTALLLWLLIIITIVFVDYFNLLDLEIL